MHALMPIPSQLARFIRLPAEENAAGDGGRPDPLHPHRIDDRHVPVAAVSGLPRPQPRRLPRAARQRHRGAGGSRGSRRALRDARSSAAAAATSSALEIDGQMPTRLQRFVVQELEIRDDAVFIKEGMLGLADTSQLIVPERPDLVFKPLQHPLPRAHPRVQRRLLRRHPQEGHRGPSPLRVLRRGGAAAAPGGRRSQRAGHQVDALPHLQRQPDRARAEGGGRARQVGDGRGRAQGALRRGRQHPLGARSGKRRRARGLRLHRAQDARQARPDRAPGRRRARHLLPHRHRQLPPGDGQDLQRPVVLHRRSRGRPRRHAHLQFRHRLRRAGRDRGDGRQPARHPRAHPRPHPRRDRPRQGRPARPPSG